MTVPQLAERPAPKGREGQAAGHQDIACVQKGKLDELQMAHSDMVLSVNELGWVTPEFWEQLDAFPVAGRLKKAVPFWQEIGASDWVLDILRNGYHIPFLHEPDSVALCNNKSALRESAFVETAILELIKNDCVTSCSEPPKIVNPLSVAIQGNGKKRLILDLSYPNKFVYKEKFKMEDYKVALEYLYEADRQTRLRAKKWF